jgi:hypothetical protein
MSWLPIRMKRLLTLFTTLQQNVIRMSRNTRGQLPPPIENLDHFCEPHEKALPPMLYAVLGWVTGNREKRDAVIGSIRLGLMKLLLLVKSMIIKHA